MVAEDDSFEIGHDGKVSVDLIGNDLNVSGGKLTITKINSIPVQEGSHITLPSGLEIVVNADGTITVISDATDAPGEASFSYEVINEKGVTDVGFVKGQVLPCFVAGTRIDTALGPVAVEDPLVGDLVVTMDDGLQPLRWTGSRTLSAPGAMAAVCIPAGALGNSAELPVSPQHRLHLAGRTLLRPARGVGQGRPSGTDWPVAAAPGWRAGHLSPPVV